MVQSFHWVSQDLLGMSYSQFATDYCYTVAHLQLQARSGYKVYSRTIDAGDICAEIISYFQLWQRFSIQFGFGNQDTSWNQILTNLFPFYLHLFTEEDRDSLNIYRIGDN